MKKISSALFLTIYAWTLFVLGIAAVSLYYISWIINPLINRSAHSQMLILIILGFACIPFTLILSGMRK